MSDTKNTYFHFKLVKKVLLLSTFLLNKQKLIFFLFLLTISERRSEHPCLRSASAISILCLSFQFSASQITLSLWITTHALMVPLKFRWNYKPYSNVFERLNLNDHHECLKYYFRSHICQSIRPWFRDSIGP